MAFPKEEGGTGAVAPAGPFWEEWGSPWQGQGGRGEGHAAALTWPLLPFIISENLNLTPKMGLTTLPCRSLRTRVNTLISPGHPYVSTGFWQLGIVGVLDSLSCGEVNT